MAECRYVLARIVEDVVRNEPVNVGIMLQSDERIVARFLSSLPKARVKDEHLRRYLATLEDEWNTRLANGPETILLPGWSAPREVRHTDRDFLRWLAESHQMNLQFSEVRYVEVEKLDTLAFETILRDLFNRLVAGRPQIIEMETEAVPEKKRLGHYGVNERVKSALTKAEIARHFRERQEVEGRLSRWTFDWGHTRDRRGILVESVALDHKDEEENRKVAAYVGRKTADVRQKAGAEYRVWAVVYSRDGDSGDSYIEAKRIMDADGVEIQELHRVDDLVRHLGTQLLV